jgi:hypothetical protein
VNVTEVLNVAFRLLDAIAVVVEDFDTTCASLGETFEREDASPP